MVQLLDCTLRDGAHVNGGQFGFDNIRKIVNNLTESGLDYVELGFLRNVDYNHDVSFYPVIEKAYAMLPDVQANLNVGYALMARADEYDITKLTECDGRIKLIRIAFYYDDLEDAVRFAKEVKARGYDITFNLINTPGASVESLGKVVDYANRVMPDVLTIVDTFGVLQADELDKVLRKYDGDLASNIKIGLHVHENLALAYSLAQHFISHVNTGRDIVIDGSLMGMGRIPGNLCIELMADYMNARFERQYDLVKMLELISNIIDPIKKSIPWGYSTAYFLSAKYRVHRSYSEYLLKQGLSLDKMDFLLKQVTPERALRFDKDYMDLLILKNC